VVEGTGLENRHTGEPGIVSSNLTLSVTPARRHATADRAGGRFESARADCESFVIVGTGGRVV
jgi:hypothetical protein